MKKDVNHGGIDSCICFSSDTLLSKLFIFEDVNDNENLLLLLLNLFPTLELMILEDLGRITFLKIHRVFVVVAKNRLTHIYNNLVVNIIITTIIKVNEI